MGHYLDNQESVKNIAVGLMERGWKVYGFHEDQSDMMTDYYSPAYWEGIAEKNGFVLLVNVYGNGQSGYKKTKQGFAPDYTKIAKLQATIDDEAASQNEKVVAQKKIDNMKQKQIESTVIVEEYPIFKHGNPKRSNWHLEKDGEIIAKGNGAFKCTGYLFGSDKKETMVKVNKFIDRVESFMASTEQLEAVQEKVIKKVVKPVRIESSLNDINENVYLVIDKELTGQVYKGYVYKFDRVFDGKNGNSYRFVRMNKKLNKVLTGSANPANLIYFSEANFNRLFEKGCFHFAELKEVEEISYKTVYKKTTRKGQKDNLLQGETTPETPQQENTITDQEVNHQQEETQTVEQNENNIIITYKTGTGQKGNGIELYFTDKPDQETRQLIKSYGFRWGGKSRPNVWWAILSNDTLKIAEQLTGDQQNNSQQEESPVTYPEIEIDDISNYTVSKELQKREYNSSWIFRSGETDRTKELQGILQNYQDQVVELINSTDNQYIIYQLKKSIQYFKKHYSNNFIKRLEHNANNPSWFVTGASGRNRRRDEKMNNRYDNLMRESIELVNGIESRIKKYRNKIEKERRESIQNQINQEIKNNTLKLDFQTITKEFEYMGVKERKRVYICDNYFITKTWGCYRIFDLRTCKEIHDMKTTENLQDAKNYVLYLIKKDQEQSQMAM